MSGLPEVVMATVRGQGPRVAVRYDTRAEKGWYCPTGRAIFYLDGEVTDRRPLLLIDPEDATQVRALVDAWTQVADSGPLPDQPMSFPDLRMRAALRTLAQPATPEPTGLGAVVAGRDGRRWTRIVAQNHIDKRWATTSYVGTWAEVDAVEVLRAGWSE